MGHYLESAEFRVKQATFMIYVYPNGYNEENKGYMSVFLRSCGEEEVVVDLVTATVGDVTRQFRNRTFYVERRMWGRSKWCSHEDIKKHLVDGVLKIKFEVEMKSDMVALKNDNNTPMIQTPWLLQKLYNRLETCSDFILMCQGQGVPCHRTILEGASPYFR